MMNYKDNEGYGWWWLKGESVVDRGFMSETG
jgi:hypothetical protein